jgi:hypothetical protein
VQQSERGRVAEGEDLTGGEVEEEPGDPRPVRVGGDQGAQHQGKVEAGQPGQLSGDHHRGQHRGGDQPEQRPTGPVHVSDGCLPADGRPPPVLCCPWHTHSKNDYSVR